MREKVSILIPAFNAEKWIKETIISAIGQAWPDCEIIIVDDGSTDSTYEIARAYQSKNLKVVKQENMGASAARNKALSLAQGDYIQWLDADDILAPDKISNQINHINTSMNPLTLLSSSYGTFFYRSPRARFKATNLWQDLTPVEWLMIRFMEKVWMSPAVWLVSRGLTEKSGPWDERLSFNDDGEYFSRVVAASEMVSFVPEAKSYYRQVNIKSLSNTRSHKACESLFLSLKLSIESLLHLENTARTREAAVKLLQSYLVYFYPEEDEILRKVAKLAQDLGGGISPPELKLKYLLIEKMFGLPTAKSLAFAIPLVKKKMFGEYDRLMAVISE